MGKAGGGDGGRVDNTVMKNRVAAPSWVAARSALGVIATVAAGAAIYWLRDILTPLAMAIFLLIMIDGVKRSVEARTPLNSRMAGIAALTLVVLAFFASIAIIVNGAAGFFGEASGVSQNIGPRIDQIIRDAYGLVRLANPPTAQDLINGVDVRGWLTSMAFQVQGIASGVLGDKMGVDEYEVGTKLTMLQTQIQASYQVTAMLSQLSLSNFL